METLFSKLLENYSPKALGQEFPLIAELTFILYMSCLITGTSYPFLVYKKNEKVCNHDCDLKMKTDSIQKEKDDS